MKPLELSQTYMNDLLCPYRYWQLQGLDVKEDDDEAANSGVLLHLAAAKYGYHLRDAGKYRDERWYFGTVDKLCDEYSKKGKISDDDVFRIMDEGEVFASVWSLDISAEKHCFEERLYVPRPGGTGDRFGGTPDYVAGFDGWRYAKIDEYKFGHRPLEYDEVLTDRQCIAYAWLVYNNHPECELVSARLIAPRFGPNNIAGADLRHEYCEEYMQDLLAEKWAVVDECRTAEEWPVEANWSACKWCKLICPKAEDKLEELRRNE